MIFVSDSLGLPVNTGKYSFGHRGHQMESPTPDLHHVNHVKIPVQPDQSNDDRIAILGSLGANQNCTDGSEGGWAGVGTILDSCHLLLYILHSRGVFGSSSLWDVTVCKVCRGREDGEGGQTMLGLEFKTVHSVFNLPG